MTKSIYLLAFAACVAPAAAQNSPYIEAVDEYVPAPGQFVNELPRYSEGDDAATMASKCTAALAHNAGGLITLGGWGGYVTFHFDHPVVNVPGQNDLFIAGNAIEGNSEAGIVMVSRDDNHNGRPDDTWYEIAGSADDGLAEVWYDYELTYRCLDPMADIPWTDNYGNQGVIARNAFHKQAYFPLWLQDQGEITFRGTRLPDNARDTSGNGTYWVLTTFDNGYVDNHPNKNREGCSINLDRAVSRTTRVPVNLNSIDFVRVYTGLNQSAGWLGETSTEVAGAEDLHPDAHTSIRSVRPDSRPVQRFDLMGRPVNHQENKSQLTITKQVY